MKKELIELQTKTLHSDPNAGIEENNPEIADDADFLVVLMLLNKKLTYCHFPTNLEISNAQATEVWQRLLEIQPPDLHTIIWRDNLIEEWNVRPFFNRLLTDAPAFLSNLQVLRLETFQCNDKDLINVADHLTKLRSVNFC
jgi:hypothetical protein